MRLIRGLANARPADRGVVIAIGNFDGLHLGHQAILARVVQHSADLGVVPALLTFEPHPREFFSPQQAPARLMRLRDKLERLAACGIERVMVLRFCAALAAWPARRFVEEALVAALGARQVVVGEGFRFGRGREGDIGMLRALGLEHGFGVDTVAALEVAGERVSSTRIRAALSRGRMSEAATLLGRDYRISGRVVAGNKLGRQLGFATANLRLQRRVVPMSGIFAARVIGATDKPWPAVASLGTRPTVGGGEILLEAHLFDFEGDLYGRRIAVEFVERLRDEQHFPGLDAMVRQMHQDARAARAILGA